MRRIFFIAAVVVFLAVMAVVSASAEDLSNFGAPFEYNRGDVVVLDFSSVVQDMLEGDDYMAFLISLLKFQEKAWVITQIDSGYNYSYTYYLRAKENKNLWILLRCNAKIFSICFFDFGTYEIKAVKKGKTFSENFSQGVPIVKMAAFFSNDEETFFLREAVFQLNILGKY
jgi:hypothetical protein